jgi:hypothetical protein
MKVRLLHIGGNAVLGLAVFTLPWWVTFAIAVLFLVRFSGYEILFWGFVMDVLYGASLPGFFGFPFMGTAGAALLLMVSFLIKRRLIFYRDLYA